MAGGWLAPAPKISSRLLLFELAAAALLPGVALVLNTSRRSSCKPGAGYAGISVFAAGLVYGTPKSNKSVVATLA